MGLLPLPLRIKGRRSGHLGFALCIALPGRGFAPLLPGELSLLGTCPPHDGFRSSPTFSQAPVRGARAHRVRLCWPD